jgi:repressor of nif and glnA expression
MTTNEHRLEAALAILADANGPLTPSGVAARLQALGHTVERMHARRLLERLVGRGLAERFDAGAIRYAGNRIYFPTKLGREEAQALEASRIEGV